jgi:hypothetical protein
MSYGRKPIISIKYAWALLRQEAGLDERVTPYSIRRGIAREMSKRKAPIGQISIFLGYLSKDLDATTSIKAQYEPNDCTKAALAIESAMIEIPKYLKRADICQPVRDIATLAELIPSKTKVGDGKRRETPGDSRLPQL